MTTSPSIIKNQRFTNKVDELVNCHGEKIRQLILSERIPHREVANFFGRHRVRREFILARMGENDSYSKAYRTSNGTFDTKTWKKVGIRTAACRGHVLTTAVRLANAKNILLHLSEADRGELSSLASRIRQAALELIRVLARCELTASQTEPVCSKKIKKPCSFKHVKEDRLLSRIRASLKTAGSKLEKNCRDVPQMLEKLGQSPSVNDAANILVEASRNLSGVSLLLDVLEGRVTAERVPKKKTIVSDPWGVGAEYGCRLSIQPSDESQVTVVTHRKPDADALVSVWLAKREIFSGQTCFIKFADRKYSDGEEDIPTCVVDVGREHDPSRLRFDHKPPAFVHRDEECATSLVWRHVQELGRPVDHLESLVRLVHDGDAATRRGSSVIYKNSRETGLHALVRRAKAYSVSDRMLYNAIEAWLDEVSSIETDPAQVA